MPSQGGVLRVGLRPAMTSAVRRRITRFLLDALGPNRSRASHLLGAAVTSAQYGLAAILALRQQQQPAQADVKEWLQQIADHGYCVVPNFYSPAQCQQCVMELERLFAEYPAYVQRKSDWRMFGVEAGSPLLAQFAREPRLWAAAQHVLREPSVNAFTLGARIDYTPGNKGSGEGWHRDSFVVQFKAILYLSDVHAGEGPFQLVADSQRLPRLMLDMLQARLGLAQNRVQNAQVEALLKHRPERLKTMLAPAGTLFLVNTSAIHRGEPLTQGSRYALTNYFVQKRRAGPAMDAHFAPVLTS